MQMEIVNLPLELIDEDTEQPRYQFDEESIQELMNSIAVTDQGAETAKWPL